VLTRTMSFVLLIIAAALLGDVWGTLGESLDGGGLQQAPLLVTLGPPMPWPTATTTGEAAPSITPTDQLPTRTQAPVTATETMIPTATHTSVATAIATQMMMTPTLTQEPDVTSTVIQPSATATATPTASQTSGPGYDIALPLVRKGQTF